MSAINFSNVTTVQNVDSGYGLDFGLNFFFLGSKQQSTEFVYMAG